MDGKERVMRTLEFQGPDRLPVDLWTLPAVEMEYGKQLESLDIPGHTDIASVVGPLDHGSNPVYYELGVYKDPWGSVWNNIQAGIIGEVKVPVFEEYDGIDTYEPPVDLFCEQWEEEKDNIAEKIAQYRKDGKFVIGGWISIFERMQYLRGTENLYCDIALEEEELFRLCEIVMKYQRAYTDKWLEMDIDAMAFGDDWGTQISLLISPEKWKSIFKPMYKEMIDKIKAAGKKVFFHSDGHIFDLYPEFIELGVDAINSQLWCMGVEKVAEQYAGKITFWGEISRQTTLPKGTPEDIQNAAKVMKQHLFVNGGGLIGQSEVNRDVPFENIKTVLNCWNP